MLYVHCDIFARGTMPLQPPTRLATHDSSSRHEASGYLYSNNIDDGFLMVGHYR